MRVCRVDRNAAFVVVCRVRGREREMCRGRVVPVSEVTRVWSLAPAASSSAAQRLEASLAAERAVRVERRLVRTSVCVGVGNPVVFGIVSFKSFFGSRVLVTGALVCGLLWF